MRLSFSISYYVSLLVVPLLLRNRSSGRFYGKSNQVLDMTSTSYGAGSANAEIHFTIGEYSFGPILVAQSERGICAIFLGDDPDELVCNLQV